MSPGESSARRIINLLGKRDEPTDGVEQYCLHLAEALRVRDFRMEIARVAWSERGWQAALSSLRQKAADWRGCWVFLHYTALAWSPRGFPLRVPRVIRALRDAGVHLGVVYHDAQPLPGSRVVDQLRRLMQQRVMRQALRSSEIAIVTIPAEKLPWISAEAKSVAFIPVGANLPSPATIGSDSGFRKDHMPTVAVFSVTGGGAEAREVSQITGAVRFATERLGKIRLLVFGRNADSAEGELRKSLRGVQVDLRVSGVLPENDVARLLRSSDVLLFVRGPISSRRGSAIAGIAYGLPVIACAGSETAAPITEAGVVLVSGDDAGALGGALLRVLSDTDYHARLAERSQSAYEKHFSWQAIAARYTSVIGKATPEKES